MADFVYVLTEDEDGIYDVPPSTRPSKINHNQSDYLNFTGSEVLPIPSLPPKKRTSINLDEKFGINTSADKISVPSSPSVVVVENTRKYPVAAPRMKSLDPKQPVAMPRCKTRVNGVSPVLKLSDATITESNDSDLKNYPSSLDDDRQNNNLSDFSNLIAMEPSNQDVSVSSISMQPIYELDHPAFVAEHSSNCSGSSDEYMNADLILKLPNNVQNEINECQDYMNIAFDINGKTVSNVSSASELKPMLFVKSAKQTSISDLRSAAADAEDLKAPVLQTTGPQGSMKSNASRDVQKPDFGLNEQCKDYCNAEEFLSMDYMNVEKLVPTAVSDFNIKDLMVDCLSGDNTPPYLNSSANHTRYSVSKSISIAESFDSFSDLMKLCDPFHELASNDDNDSAKYFDNRSSAEFEMFCSSSSPPKITPPPLPDGLLIDFSGDSFYKLPVVPVPVIPSRPLQSSESPPPIPTRKGSADTKQITVSGVKIDSVPAGVSATPSTVVISPVISPPVKLSPKVPSMKSAEGTSRSVFYVGPPGSHENVYETEPVAHEMEPSNSCPSLNNGMTSSDQSGLYEETDSLANSGLNAYLQGFLYLTGNNSKPEKKWFKLEVGSLNIYQNSQTATPYEVVEKVSMVSISNIKDDSRQGFGFELSTRPPTIVYQFSADSSAERASWITQIARNMALVNANDLKRISDINRGGNAFVRFGAESAWIHTWLHLVHKTLSIYNKDEKFDEVDLRKCKGLRSLQLADRCTKGFEMCPPLAIDLPSGRVIFIQSDLKNDQDGWLSALKDSITMVDASLTYQALTSDNVPVMIDKCINYVSAFGLDIEGIYRLNGQNSKVTKLQEEFRSDTRGMIIRPSEYTVHDVANALKRFFRQLDEPLLTNELYDGWIKASAIKTHSNRLETYKGLLSVLPCINYHTLKRVVFHLAMVSDKKAVNKMDSNNLASIFGPILFKVDKVSSQPTGFGATNQEIKILKDLVDDHQWIFDIKDEELDQEKKIADAVKRIEKLNLAQTSQQSFTILKEGVLLGVYINDKHGDVVTLKVSNSMTAEELQKFVAEKTRIVVAGNNWTLFEVICNGELERPIHSSENIHEVTMKWTNWPHEFCQDNYLCFKFNKLQEPLQIVHDYQSGSVFSELLYCSRKSFHKYYFQYSQCSLGFRKDSRAENPTTSWLIEDIVIYFGIQRIRHPPTQWGFTFYSLNDKLTAPCFGHSVCCSTEEEMYQWLSAMIFSQHQHGCRSPSERPIVNYSHKPPNDSSLESNLNTTSSVSSKWKLPFGKRR